VVCRRLLLLLIAMPLPACIPWLIGDSMVRFKGSVTDERGVAYQDCQLELLDGPDRLVVDRRPIASKFDVTFVHGGPGQASYPLRIACKESAETFTSEPTRNPRDSLAPIDLGAVQLKRLAK